MVSSALSFSLMVVCVRGVGRRIPLAELVLVRALVSLVLSWWLLRRARISPLGNRRGLLMTRGVVGTAALYFFYAAVARLPMATATVLQYIYPTLTAALADTGKAVRVVVSNGNAPDAASQATLTVTTDDVAATITTQPVNRTVVEGESASFTVGART